MVEMEKRGLPAVALVARSFSNAWRTSTAAWGQPRIATVVIPQVVAGQPHDLVRDMADHSIEGIVAGLTQPVEDPALTVKAATTAGVLAVEGEDQLAAVEAMNSLFLRENWGDGFPLVPPTTRAVERMLTGTRRKPQEVISIMEPGFGVASVEKIAINAVMAGCQPEHLPILIAAVQALAEPQCILREMQVSTVPEAPLLLVNGPIARRVKLNAGTCVMGPGAINYANSVIGRALRLILINIGDCAPGQADINTMGLPTKYSLCLAENEEASPWDPYHVELGYKREESTVTVVAVSGVASIIDMASAPEPILDTAASALRFTGSAPLGEWLRGGKVNPLNRMKVQAQHTLLLAPDHARVIAKAGWSKQDVKNYLHRTARIKVKELLARRGLRRDEKGQWVDRPDLQWMESYPDIEIPVATGPGSFIVAVAGGSGNISEFFWGIYGSATKPVDE